MSGHLTTFELVRRGPRHLLSMAAAAAERPKVSMIQRLDGQSAREREVHIRTHFAIVEIVSSCWTLCCCAHRKTGSIIGGTREDNSINRLANFRSNTCNNSSSSSNNNNNNNKYLPPVGHSVIRMMRRLVIKYGLKRVNKRVLRHTCSESRKELRT